ncbi:hypothetical protein FSP39_003039 [Pinctada imbricata]|uniref:Uncharacterized protein n=1 Tax=Pinctada imbricata TaxID=66713 RepID=A0AA88XRX0_PINIB|nr:hypothetical protein FSP39_003039 [Pinctada imbricata]
MSFDNMYQTPRMSSMGPGPQAPQGQGCGSPIPPTMQYQYPLMTSSPANGSQLSDMDINRIAVAVKNIMHGEIHQLVQDKMAPLVDCVQRLSDENKRLQRKVDELEMYSRRSCVRVFGVPEENKDTDTVVMTIAKKLDVPLEKSDLVVSHRVGKSDPSKPRPIIARISNYNARHSLIKGSKNLSKVDGMQGWSVNQELTKARRKVAYEARQLVKAKIAKSTFIWDGKIFVVDHNERKHLLVCLDDLLHLKSMLTGEISDT